MSNMGERIKEARKARKITQKALADEIGLSGNYIYLIEAGREEPSERTVKDMCRKLKVNYQWLVNGVGEMFMDDDGDAQAIIDSVMTSDNEFAKKTLVAFAKLSEEKWKLIEEIIKEIETG